MTKPKENWRKQLEAEFIPLWDLGDKKLSPKEWFHRVEAFIERVESEARQDERRKVVEEVEKIQKEVIDSERDNDFLAAQIMWNGLIELINKLKQ